MNKNEPTLLEAFWRLTIIVCALSIGATLATIREQLDDTNKMLWDIDYMLQEQFNYSFYPEDPTTTQPEYMDITQTL